MKNNCINTAALKKSLPYGAIKEIANRSKTSIWTVSKVIKGGVENPVVLKTIKDYLVEIQQTKADINTLIANSQIAC